VPKQNYLAETLLATSLPAAAGCEIITTGAAAVTLYLGKYRVESARLRDWDYRSRGWYFVTICARNRDCVFGDVVNGEMYLSRLGQITEAHLQSLQIHYNNVQVDAHVVMPNHLHAIVAIGGERCFSPHPKLTSPSPVASSLPASPKAGSLSAIIRSFKAGVTSRCCELGLTQPIWQPRFYDRLLRSDAVIDAVRDYIRNNPANWAQDTENRS